MDAVRKSLQRGNVSVPTLKRSNANKSFCYDSSGSRNRRISKAVHDAGGESPDTSNHSVDSYLSEQEFSVHGRGDVEEMNSVFRYLGLPAPAQLGISSDVYQDFSSRPSPSPRVGDGSIANFTSPHDDAAAGKQPDRGSSILSPPTSGARVETASPSSQSEAVAANSPETLRDNNEQRTGKRTQQFSHVVEQDGDSLKKRFEDDAAALSTFIHCHGDEDQLSSQSRQSRIAGAALVGPCLSMPPAPTTPPAIIVERSLSDPIPASVLRPIEASLLKQTSIGGGNLKVENVEPEKEIVRRASEGPSTSATLKSSSAASQSPTNRMDANTTRVEGKRSSNSPPRVLKPPPRMSVMRIPEQEMSTVDILGSLAPDANIQAWSSSSDDEDSSEMDESEETETFPPIEPKPQPPNHVSSNGRNAGDQVQQGENPRAFTVDVPGSGERLEFLNEVGKNPEIDLPEVAPSLQEHPLGPKYPWTKGEVLGAGSFGTVYEAVDRDGMWFAVKEVSMVEQDKQAQQCIAQLMQEVELLSQFKHENIVQYLGTEKAHGKLYIFLELASRGSLAAVYKRIKLADSQISAYTREILKGLKYLHDRCIVHRDIKCANILVDTKGKCKLADFGMAKQISSLDQMKSCKGSAYWMAPEVIDPKKVYGPPADIWSLGCSILEMATGSPPFGDMEWYRVLWTVGHGTAPPIPDSLSDAAKDFVKHCLEVNPMKRPTASRLLEHQFVWQAGGLTPTYSTSMSFPPAVPNLQTITEEKSADMSSSQRSNSLSNGNSRTTANS